MRSYLTLRALYAALLVSFACGCTDDDTGYLTGEYLVVKSCREGKDREFKPPRGYEMTGRFFAVHQLGEVAFIRMQPGGKPLDRTDAFVIQINDIDFVKHRLGERIYLDNPQIRAALHVLGSCPDTAQSMLGIGGFVIFRAFGVGKDDLVKAAFELELVDDRTDELVGINFSGAFEFTVKVGQPYQPFTSYND